MRALPAAPPPLPGELLGSWLGRLACLYGVAPRPLWNTLAGLPATELASPACAGLPWAEQVGRVAGAARLDRRLLAGMTPDAMLSGAPARWLRATRASAAGVAWCPVCLCDDLEQGRPPYLRRLWAIACVVVCPHHRDLLIDRCAFCGAVTAAAFRWAGRQPVPVCGACGAPLTTRTARRVAGTEIAAIAAATRVQTILLRALRRVSRPGRRHDAASAAPFLGNVERLSTLLVFPLGIGRRLASRIGPPYPFNALRAADAFAVLAAVAAILALPEQTPLPDRVSPADLERLWRSPVGFQPLSCCGHELFATAGLLGTAIALVLRQDPQIAALRMAQPNIAAQTEAIMRRPTRSRPVPAQTGMAAERFERLAQSVLADPQTTAMLSGAATTAARSRVLGRLARAALEVGWQPADDGPVR